MIALASIIERFEADYLAQYQSTMLPSHRKALAAMKRCRSTLGRKRSANPPCAGDVGVLRRLYAAMAASVGLGAAVSPVGRQLCGSSVARSRCLSVGSRSNTSFR